jgi:hypothetical protein
MVRFLVGAARLQGWLPDNTTSNWERNEYFDKLSTGFCFKFAVV